MNTTDLPPGTIVIVSQGLGRIVGPARRGPANGYNVSKSPDAGSGSAPHFVDAYSVQVAELGVNVCRQPRGMHWCGLVHVPQREIEILSDAPGVSGQTQEEGNR